MNKSLIAWVALAASTLALAAEDTPELPTRFERYHIAYTINADGSHAETRLKEIRVLDARALQYVKSASVSYSTSVEKAEVLEAYTRKADGRRIDVSKDNYQVSVESGREKGAPAYSDQTSLSVVFPEVAVGDVVVFSYRIVQTEPIFPGHFSTVESFPSTWAYDDVQVRFDVPAAMPIRFDARSMVEKERAEKDGRKVYAWTYENRKPVKSTRRNWSVYEIGAEPGIIASTFASQAQIASAYGERARPKAAVTDRIRALAGEIVGDRKQPREQARALYDWVATNITYAGNCVGVGAVVPRDIPFVLDNKMGDCKDHATLLEALLAAKGIRSTQALVNAGSSYNLPALPVVSMVNHVINYLPDFDLFVDSTSSDTPFGLLPFGSADKPALLVDGSKPGVRTAATPAGVNRQVTRSVLRVQPDGSVKGEMEVTLKGQFAADARSRFRHVTKDSEEELLKNAFKRGGQPGIGKLEKDDPKDLLDTYRYKVAFEMAEFINTPGAGALSILPPFYSEAPVNRFLAEAQELPESVPISCSNGYSEEEYVIHFPKGVKVLSVPPNASLSNDVLSYKATYSLKGSMLTARRIVDDRTRGNVCAPEVFAEFRKVALKAAQNAKMQVVYQ